MVRPYVWQPRTAGTRAIHAPLSSRSKTTRYFPRFTGATFFRGTARDRARLLEAFPAADPRLRESEPSSRTDRIAGAREIPSAELPRTRASGEAEAVFSRSRLVLITVYCTRHLPED